MSNVRSTPISLQLRDLALLRGLFESRIMTADHIAILHFDGRKEAAKKRLQKLKAAGLIAERPRKAFDPAVLCLTRKAFVLLKEKGVLDEYPPLDAAAFDKRTRVSALTLKHELEIMDVKAAFHSSIKQTDVFTVEKFNTWPLLYQFEAFRAGRYGAEVTVKPDGFIRIHEKEDDGGLSEHTFYLELDRSTETQDTLVSRASSYVDYYKSGDFAVKNGGTRADYKEFPFRVLIVLKNAERRNNTAERLLQSTPPIHTQVLLSTFGEVTTNPLGAIWMPPLEYRNATTGTPFDVTRERETWGYKRQMERELFVERMVKKIPLLDEYHPSKALSTNSTKSAS